MKIAIYGYGNLGRGVEAAVRQNADMELIGVFTRRDPASVQTVTGVPVYAAETVLDYTTDIDVMIICGGSATDLPVMTPELARNFNVVDSFDTHARIPEHFANVDRAALTTAHTALISAGWDPGLFSLARLYMNSVLPEGKDYTFWGRGVSQGHSDAIRRIPGVKDARQYTVPVPDALERVRSGENPDLSTRQKHTRECFVVAEEGADLERIEREIREMPNYFADYDTTVTFISEEELKKNHAELPHGGTAMVRWHGNISDWKRNQNLVLNIKNLQLKDLSPYSVGYLAYPLTDGTFSFTSENSIRNSQLEGRNNLDLYNPMVGEKRKDVDAQVKIPLKAALYVLKDKDDKVQFDIPVAGNIDSPEFSYMKIVWKTLGNLLVKVATSPFRAVSKALGVSGNLEFIAFDPLQAQFNSEQYSTLNKMVEVLHYDTSIVVTFEPQINALASAKAQSLYLLKEEYYMSRHPEKANTAILPQAVLFGEVNAITVKDTGFVAFLQTKGLGKRPTDKDVQRLAERLYPKDAAISSLEIVAGYRNEFLKRFFAGQGIGESQVVIAPVADGAQQSGYVINSSLVGDEGPEVTEDYEYGEYEVTFDHV